MHDQQTLAAHLHNMSQFNGGSMLNPRTPATSHMNTLQSHFQSLANGKLSPNDIHERHTPQSDENSAGSGSVGAGPRINGHIEVKLEEVSVRVKPGRVKTIKRQWNQFWAQIDELHMFSHQYYLVATPNPNPI